MMKDPPPRPLLYEGLRARVHRNMVRLDADGMEIMLTEEAARALAGWLTVATQQATSTLGG